MISIRCKSCNIIIEGHPTKAKSCGCPNFTMIMNDKISARDLSQVELISGLASKRDKESSLALTKEDLAFQEARRNRKVRKLEFEIK
jgi:hypothetical protein